MPSTHVAPAPRPRRSARSPKQPYRILVASDGEPSALGAVRTALALARRKIGNVHVLTVVRPFPHVAPSPFQASPPALVDEGNRRAAVEAVERQLKSVRGTKDWVVTAVMGWAPDCIIEAATRWNASIIVVGTGKHSGVDRWIGSETAIALTRRSTIPVLALPETARQLPTKAVAAIDFTDASVDAARIAATLLGPNGVLTLFHASMLIKPESEPGTMVDIYTTGVTEKLHAIRDRIHRDTRRQVKCVARSGEIVAELMDFVEHEQCDLVALGGHDQGVIDRLLLGSVRTKVLRRAHCPVLIAPHGTAKKAG